MSIVYGLIVCGGKSTRMGKDKSLINYHGRPQRYYLYDMLLPLCDKVFISCNSTQASAIDKNYPVIIDAEEYTEIGPMGALLTAFDQYPNASFLVVGCDYPFIKQEHLQALLKVQDEAAYATAYFTISDNIYEPLIALYKNEIQTTLYDNFYRKNYSLRHLLEQVHSTKIFPDSKELIKSVDTPLEYKKTINKLSHK